MVTAQPTVASRETADFVSFPRDTVKYAVEALNVATSKHHPDNSFYGLAIGFTVAAGVSFRLLNSDDK